jgi:hypothetical protein
MLIVFFIEMKPTLRKFDNQNLYLKRLLWEIENSRSGKISNFKSFNYQLFLCAELFLELKRGSSLYKRAHKKGII